MTQVTIRRVEKDWVAKAKADAAERGVSMNQVLVDALQRGSGVATPKKTNDLKKYLRERGTPIPENDIWISAACVEQGCTLHTSDKHFECLPQVRVQWPEV